MVQMKGNIRYVWVLEFQKLYIPHGSDERGGGYRISGVTEDFISHMVQMKG